MCGRLQGRVDKEARRQGGIALGRRACRKGAGGGLEAGAVIWVGGLQRGGAKPRSMAIRSWGAAASQPQPPT